MIAQGLWLSKRTIERRARAALAVAYLAGPFAVLPAAADFASDHDLCRTIDESKAVEKIAACTRVVKTGRLRGRDLANAYQHRAEGYRLSKDYAHALEDFNRAISIDPKIAYPYLNRAEVYRLKGDSDKVIADATQAIRLDPALNAAYTIRGYAYMEIGAAAKASADFKYTLSIPVKGNDGNWAQDKARARLIQLAIAGLDKGDLDGAIAEVSKAIRLNPKRASLYTLRGRGHLYNGNPSGALADLGQANELDPTNAYNALWLDIVAQRNSVPSRLQQAISNIDMTEWPGPVIRMFLGQTTPAAVLAAADDPDAETKKTQICEANFYRGELALRQGAKDEALRLLRLAASNCPKSIDELGPASAELKTLGTALGLQ